MIKSKKAGKTLDEIGKRWYDFDYKLERVIYCYLCCCKIRVKHFARDLRKLDEGLKFESYQEWKQYVCNKYQNYRTEELSEFSRYLNQRIRNKSPFNESLNILCTAVIALVLTKVFEMFIFNYEELYMKFIGFISYIVLAWPLAYGVVRILYPIFDSNVEKNFFADYKEIIDEMIEGRITNLRQE